VVSHTRGNKAILLANQLLPSRIILENSGVAEPQNIRDSFNEALMMGHPIARRVHLEGLITVVDSVTFISDFGSKAPMSIRPDLGVGESVRPVVDLLVEQIECADLIVLNKADALEESKLESLKPIISSLNSLAEVVTASYGRIPIELIGKSGIASRMNTESQHRSSVVAAKKQEAEKGHEHEEHVCDDHCDHDHHHDHHHSNSNPEKKFGITSFVYLRRRPFHPLRQNLRRIFDLKRVD